MSENNFSEQEWQACLKVLRVLSRRPEAAPDTLELKGLVAKIYERARRAKRQKIRDAQNQHNLELKQSTVLFQQNQALDNGVSPPLLAPVNSQKNTVKLLKPARCYCCKNFYDTIHFFYHSLCAECSELNFAKRLQTSDLRGRTILLTGGRMKIGFQTALRLLRDGAKVIVTTRFPHSGAEKFAREKDFPCWQSRLKICGLDLRNISAVERLINFLYETEEYLDVIINNAAQTVKRPREFYANLIAAENIAYQYLPKELQAVLPDDAAFSKNSLLENHRNYPNLSAPENLLIAPDIFDGHGQPLDYRSQNSWTMRLDEVSTLELLETQLVNVVAPFLLNSKLKPLLLKSPNERKFIINVSAMEGQFNRATKTHFHPHTNMAKAALNMLTRTAAQDYARAQIFMNSVDTGWITEENPHPKKQRVQAQGFVTPLDELDGAARIYDPIAQGVNNSQEPLFGCFLKNYLPGEW